ncbi:MAG: SMP-30/gluconolactonase/LRE family protein [Chloroflexi bacterium]|nr:SMP-30/gluconolactonase/LRE family protein [Chloroflexota bacterium]
MNDVEHVLSVQCKLGEGPLWSPNEQTLYWVDIQQMRLHRYVPGTGEHSFHQADRPVTAVGLRAEGDGFVTACGHGLVYWNPFQSALDLVTNPISELPHMRFNDGKVDPRGRFWIGTMSDAQPEMAEGKLYRLDPDRTLHEMENNITISNGLAWSPDYTLMYYTDSLRRRIYVYDFDVDTGSISNRRVFAELPEAEGQPDGMTIDRDGHIWSAVWDGWKIIRFNPAGERVAEVKLPVARVTSCAFGGPNLDTLYITTAWAGLSDDERAAQPLAGDVFSLQTAIGGMDEPRYAG